MHRLNIPHYNCWASQLYFQAESCEDRHIDCFKVQNITLLLRTDCNFTLKSIATIQQEFSNDSYTNNSYCQPIYNAHMTINFCIVWFRTWPHFRRFGQADIINTKPILLQDYPNSCPYYTTIPSSNTTLAEPTNPLQIIRSCSSQSLVPINSKVWPV